MHVTNIIFRELVSTHSLIGTWKKNFRNKHLTKNEHVSGASGVHVTTKILTKKILSKPDQIIKYKICCKIQEAMHASTLKLNWDILYITIYWTQNIKHLNKVL